MTEQSRNPQNVATMPRQELKRRTVTVIGITVALVALGLFLWYLAELLLAIFGGVLLAIILSVPTDYLQAKAGLRRGVSLGLVVLVLTAIVVGVGFLTAPRIGEQVEMLGQRIPEALDQLREQVTQYGWGRRLLGRAESAPEEADAGQVVTAATGFLRITFEVIARIVVILFIGLYMAAEPKVYCAGLLHLVPRKKRPRIEEVLDTVGYTLRWWLIGQFLAMTFVFVAVWAGLGLLGVPLAFILALIAGLLNFIPNLGAIIGSLPGILLGLMQGWEMALYVALVYIVVQNIEGYVVTPLIQRRVVHLPPAVTLAAEVMMALLLGFFGLVFATPLAAAALVATKMLYVQDVLGYREVEVLGDKAA